MVISIIFQNLVKLSVMRDIIVLFQFGKKLADNGVEEYYPVICADDEYAFLAVVYSIFVSRLYGVEEAVVEQRNGAALGAL